MRRYLLIAAGVLGTLAAFAQAAPVAPVATVRAPAAGPGASGGFLEPRYSAVLPLMTRRASALGSVAVRAAAPLRFLPPAELLPEGASVRVPVVVTEPGLYEISLEYYPMDTKPLAPEVSLQLDGSFPFAEARRIVLPVEWKSAGKPGAFATDRFGNELLPVQEQDRRWYAAALTDPDGLQERPFLFYLPRGRTLLGFTNLQGPFRLRAVTVQPPFEVPGYEDYRRGHPSVDAGEVLVRREAETPDARNSPSVKAVPVHDPGAHPYDTRRQLMNALDGKTWKIGGQEAGWIVEVPKDGWYRLVLAAEQDQPDKARSPVFRSLRIDGALPFAEAAHAMFPPAAGWTNMSAAGRDGRPWELYLSAGPHVVSLQVDVSVVRPVLETMNDVLGGIRQLAVDIRKVTGNTADRYRDWNITDYIPDIPARLSGWAADLDAARGVLTQRGGFSGRARETLGLRQAAVNLRALAARPNEIPRSLGRLSEGTGSAAQILGDLIPLVSQQPLTVDALYLVSGRAEVPRPGASLPVVLWEGVKRFVFSFVPQPYVTKERGVELRVWINRPRDYLPIIQSLADERFTPATGIPVALSLNIDDGTIILANAAGRQPDVALSVTNTLPFDMGLRGAATDLRQFADFAAVASRFAPGAFLPYIVNDSVYALPETQDFWVLFYRKDILASLQLAVPDTWDDVKAMLPVLQRFGMNFYLPIGGAAGTKAIYTMVPFIYQNGGELYSPDGTRVGIDSEEALRGMRLMTDLYTVYSLPQQTPNFYDRFRTANLPVGVSNFPDYVKLTTAAPEIAGWWAIAPHPGVRDAAGTVERWVPGSAQAALVFSAGKRQAQAWAFLAWWTSTDTQVELQNRLRSSIGAEALWNSANIDAFSQLPIPRTDRQVILEQWKWMREVPKVPGSYMLEREISNAWSRVVFDGENPRQAVDEAVVNSNREIERRMEEFGYMKNGVAVRPYRVPDIATVRRWSAPAGGRP